MCTVRSRMRFPASMLDLNRYQSTAHGHEFDGLSRVVMVRKTDQRTFASAKSGEIPKYETVTRETIETFHGNKIERKVTSLEKSDIIEKATIPADITAPQAQSKQTPKKCAVPAKKRPVIKTQDDFASECLKAHNEYRAAHGSNPLKLNKRMCKDSLKWAEVLAGREHLEESKNTEYGENLFCCWSSNPLYQASGNEPVDSWYDESKSYDFSSEPTNLKCGHFTQVVWKDTKELGVAFAKARSGKIFVVCNYSPPGNFIGQFIDNVPPIGGFKNRENSGSKGSINESIGSAGSRTQSPRHKKQVTLNVDNFEQECLNAHNEYRKLHNVQPLRLNRRICKYAEEWAKMLAIKGQMEHRKNSEYGENLFCSWSSNPNHAVNGSEPVENWYSEIKVHVFGKEPSNLKSGHFTQVIWRDSSELGVGIARNRNGQVFVVANYNPPGNFVGSFSDNVLPLGGIVRKRSTESKRDYVRSESVSKDYTDEEFSKEAVKVHNDYRRKHNVGNLKYSETLTLYAKEWAETLAKEDKFYHRADGQHGENIFCLWSSDPNATITPKDVCKSWYDEIKEYTFGTEPRNMKSGHFTQMIWKSTTEMGMAQARGKNGKVYVVANYSPRGNHVGQYCNNVFRTR